MTSYFVLLLIHVSTVFISIAGFFIRGVWMIQTSPRLQQRWVRIAPHINDTVLLLSGIVLVIFTSQYPGPAAWLNAKIIALIAYIVLGTIAINRGKTQGVKITAWVLALATYAYILMVAYSKSALPI